MTQRTSINVSGSERSKSVMAWFEFSVVNDGGGPDGPCSMFSADQHCGALMCLNILSHIFPAFSFLL